jgi:hypothetical protein
MVDKFIVSEFTDYEKAKDSCDYSLKFKRGRVVVLKGLRAACLSRDISIPDGDTVKIGEEKISVTEIIPNATRGQLAFVGSFLYFLAVYGPEVDTEFPRAVDIIYKKIDADMDYIKQDTLPGFSQTECVRKYDIMCLLNRCRLINFK